MKKLGVVAFGGNALIMNKQKGTIDEQEENAYLTCEKLLVLINSGYDLVITHGNGPQVGNIMLANAAGKSSMASPKCLSISPLPIRRVS
jgi:carbamate kinase